MQDSFGTAAHADSVILESLKGLLQPSSIQVCMGSFATLYNHRLLDLHEAVIGCCCPVYFCTQSQSHCGPIHFVYQQPAFACCCFECDSWCTKGTCCSQHNVLVIPCKQYVCLQMLARAHQSKGLCQQSQFLPVLWGHLGGQQGMLASYSTRSLP